MKGLENFNYEMGMNFSDGDPIEVYMTPSQGYTNWYDSREIDSLFDPEKDVIAYSEQVHCILVNGEEVYRQEGFEF